MEIRSNIIKDKSAFIDIANNEYNEIDTIELLCDNKFEIEILNGNQIVLKRKQPVYPKTYEECCEVLGADPSRIIVLSNRKDIIHEENKHCFEMYNLYQLLICRDAYWKIAGEEMGLGKPWKPDWNNGDQERYGIIKLDDNGYQYAESTSFVFPTEEMRDDFFNNFKDLIEECKELL